MLELRLQNWALFAHLTNKQVKRHDPHKQNIFQYVLIDF